MALDRAFITRTGFAGDRRLMLIDASGQFLSQREIPTLALFDVEYSEGRVSMVYRPDPMQRIDVTLTSDDVDIVRVKIWSDECDATLVSPEADDFFSKITGTSCRLVSMPDTTNRLVDAKYNRGEDVTSFSDGFPFLLIGTASLDELNRRLLLNGYSEPLGWDRFRPNVVVKTVEPFEEDRWKYFVVNGIQFDVVKPCARCVITTTNQLTGERSAEPLRTLSQFRTENHKVMFGQNLLTSHRGGSVEVGHQVEVVFK